MHPDHACFRLQASPLQQVPVTCITYNLGAASMCSAGVTTAHADQKCTYLWPHAGETYGSLALTFGTTEAALQASNPGFETPTDEVNLPSDVSCPGMCTIRYTSASCVSAQLLTSCITLHWVEFDWTMPPEGYT